MKLGFLILTIIVLHFYTFNMVFFFSFHFDFSSYHGLSFLPYGIFFFLYVFELEKIFILWIQINYVFMMFKMGDEYTELP